METLTNSTRMFRNLWLKLIILRFTDEDKTKLITTNYY